MDDKELIDKHILLVLVRIADALENIVRLAEREAAEKEEWTPTDYRGGE